MVGRKFSNLLLSQGHEVIVLTRNKSHQANGIQFLQWLNDDAKPELYLEDLDAFVNLAGTSLNEGRWTKKQKLKIFNSRMQATDEVIRIFQALQNKPQVFLNASAVGIYPVSESNIYTEQSPEKAQDFLGTVVQDWENHAQFAQQLGIRTCFTRFGVILAKDEGALPLMVLPYKLGIGGKIGSGKQWVSWIHVEDVAKALLFVIEQKQLNGPINFTTPDVKRMKDFCKTIGTVLHRPYWIHIPSTTLKIVLGEKSKLILEGQHVFPEKLVNAGFEFQYVSLNDALRNLYA